MAVIACHLLPFLTGLMRLRFNSIAMAEWVCAPSRTISSMTGRSASARCAACWRLLASFHPPSWMPRALARASPSFVRMEIMRRSRSANADFPHIQ
jgi:hypothetical protein